MGVQVHPLNGDYKFEVLKSNGIIVGNAYVESKHEGKEKFWHLEDLLIETNNRGQGYGTELLNYLCDYLWSIERLRIRVHPAIGQQAMEKSSEEWRNKNQQFTEEELDEIDERIEKEAQHPEYWKEAGITTSYDSKKLKTWYKKRGFAIEDPDQKHLWRCPPVLCYYQGCEENGTTKEHIPPKSFFPKNQRNQLLTVPSCKEHNNDKSPDDTYVLAQICMNASPSNRSQEVFMKRVASQLGYNNDALRKMLARDAIPLQNGSVLYKVDLARFDYFFTSLSCGIVYKSCKKSLLSNYSIQHIYHNFHDANESVEEKILKLTILNFYEKEPMEFMNFGRVKTLNTTVYSVKIFGVPNFDSSITLVHEFFGVFRVTSMLTNIVSTTK